MKLTSTQKIQLEKLWWIYGNNGKKCTLLNHKLIQGFLHYDEDRRDVYKDANKNLEERHGKDYAIEHGLTKECLDAVNKVLNVK